MTFHNPEYLFLLLLLLPMIFWYVREMHKSDASLQISSLQKLAQFPKSKRIKLRHVPFVLRTLAVLFIIVALARPQASNSWRSENTEGIDIMMALDLYRKDQHDEQGHAVLTINRMSKVYSPWSSKIYSMRRMPR